MPRVLGDIAGERHRQIEMQPQLIASTVLGVEPTHHVDLFGDLTLAGQGVHRLHRPGLDGRETVQLEDLAQHVLDGLLGEASGREELREARQWFDADIHAR